MNERKFLRQAQLHADLVPLFVMRRRLVDGNPTSVRKRIFCPYLQTDFSELLAEMDEQHEHIVDVSAGMDELTGILEWLARSVAERQFLELIRPSMELFDAIQHHIINEEDQFTPRRSASVRG